MGTSVGSPEAQPAEQGHRGFLGTLSDQFGFRQLVSDYLIPVETNSIWYLLGGVLAIALGLEIFTGFLLSLVYTPDAGQAYATVQHLIATAGWSVVINFHYYNSFLIFGLVLIHMMRVFITGGYRLGKQGLWLVGVALAGLTFIISLTGEATDSPMAGAFRVNSANARCRQSTGDSQDPGRIAVARAVWMAPWRRAPVGWPRSVVTACGPLSSSQLSSSPGDVSTTGVSG